MDLHDQRVACLQMAINMGCKPDTVIQVASELMGFVMSGASSPGPAPSTETASAEAIAACGTALPMAEAAALAAAQAIPDPGASIPDAVHGESPVAAPDAPDVTVPPSAVNGTAVEATEEVAAPAEVSEAAAEAAGSGPWSRGRRACRSARVSGGGHTVAGATGKCDRSRASCTARTYLL